MGLEIKLQKTKVMVNGEKKHIKVDNKELECVKAYIYLEETLTFQDKIKNDIYINHKILNG